MRVSWSSCVYVNVPTCVHYVVSDPLITACTLYVSVFRIHITSVAYFDVADALDINFSSRYLTVYAHLSMPYNVAIVLVSYVSNYACNVSSYPSTRIDVVDVNYAIYVYSAILIISIENMVITKIDDWLVGVLLPVDDAHLDIYATFVYLKVP